MVSYFDIPIHNPWWESIDLIEDDPQIRKYLDSSIRWIPDILKYIRVRDEGYMFYSLRGPRQVGKTTSVKLLIRDLLNDGANPLSIMYYPCDLIVDEAEFKKLIEIFVDRKPHSNFDKKYIFLDEAASVPNWQKVVKHLVDSGKLDEVTLIVSGSHSLDVENGATYLVGRTGGDPDCHKIFVPMKFGEFVRCVDKELWGRIVGMELDSGRQRRNVLFGALNDEAEIPYKLSLVKNELDVLLERYMVCGGIPSAINEYKETNNISRGTFYLYQNGFRSDLAVSDRNNGTARALVASMVKRPSMEFTWERLAKDMDRSHQTAKDYFEIMEKCFVVTCLFRTEDHERPKRLIRKVKKLFFQDPFIFHALRAWVEPDTSVSQMDAINEYLSNSTNVGHMVEGIVANHLVRLCFNLDPSPQYHYDQNLFFYKDSRGREVDFLEYSMGRMFPIEVKYQATVTERDASLVRDIGIDHGVKGLVITRDDMDYGDGYMMLPASLFCFMI